jgi:hypothetical protein
MKRATSGTRTAALAVGLLLASHVSAGDVRGNVRANDEAKTKTIDAVRPPYWQEWNGFIDPKKPGVDYPREVSAVLIGSAENRDAATVVLRNGTLSPSTIVAQQGLPLRVRNEDDFGHELYVDGLKGFDAVETSPGQTRTVQLEQTGVFVLRDKLAPHVRGYLHVIAKLTQVVNPGSDGGFAFKEVPPGKYTLKIYRGPGEPTVSELEVLSTKDMQLDPVLLGPLAAKPGK